MKSQDKNFHETLGKLLLMLRKHSIKWCCLGTTSCELKYM